MLSTEKGIKIFTRKIILQVFGDGLNSESVSYGLKKMVFTFYLVEIIFFRYFIKYLLKKKVKETIFKRTVNLIINFVLLNTYNYLYMWVFVK